MFTKENSLEFILRLAFDTKDRQVADWLKAVLPNCRAEEYKELIMVAAASTNDSKLYEVLVEMLGCTDAVLWESLRGTRWAGEIANIRAAIIHAHVA